MYFPKRIAEPKQMGKLELKIFEKESKKNYKRWIIPLADDILDKTKLEKGRILDVACGPGFLAKEFAKRSKKFNVVGIDISPYAIKKARKNCHHLNNVVFKIANVSHLPFKDESFDLVVCKDSLHHFSNLARVLRGMNRVLKPGGFLYLQDLRRDLPQYLLKMVIPPKNLFQKLQYYSARAAFTKKELSKTINNLSFSSNYKIRTRKVTQKVKQRYKKLGIDLSKLRESFQSRYSVVVKKIKINSV